MESRSRGTAMKVGSDEMSEAIEMNEEPKRWKDIYIAKKLNAKEEAQKPAEKPVEEKPVQKPAESKTKEIKASQYAKSKNDSYSRSYTTTAALNLRDGAGTQNKVLVVMPKGVTVRCYGFYTKVGNVPWLYVQYKKGDTLYTGFCSKEWLK